MLKKCKVVMLPTNEKATFNFGDMIKHITNEKLIISGFKSKKNNPFDSLWNAQHLYIISDDEIKEEDWILEGFLKLDTIKKITKEDYSRSYTNWEQGSCKKIIATTDSSLKTKVVDKNTCKPINSNIIHKYKNICLPQPSQQFIQKYVEEYSKGNIIVDVLVEYESSRKFGMWKPEFYDQIPKINPKDNTITIKKVKDCWNREEVIQLLHNIVEKGNISSQHYLPTQVNKWIEKNLN